MKPTFKMMFALGVLSMMFMACSDESPVELPGEQTVEEPEEVPDDGDGDGQPANDSIPKAGTIEIFDPTQVQDGYILVNDPGNNGVYLMDKEAAIIQEWQFSNKIGNDAQLMDNGNILGIFIADDPKVLYGGKAGLIQYIKPDGSLEWTFEYSSQDHISHHDVELLPNGNILTLVWERRTVEQAKKAGSVLELDLFPEAIIEYDPTLQEIVWEWHSWEHLVQDYDEARENYGNVADNPQRIDLNYVTDRAGDLMHANGISYDPINDLIYLSVNFYSEVWVIDHSTTTAEAASPSGGNFGRGGDLVYRFGNPTAHGDFDSQRLFVKNHYPNLFEAGKMLIFSNGGSLEQSTVFELKLPGELAQQRIPSLDPPEVLWSFTHEELYAPSVSGAVRLPNGNTLITEGDYGIWEVSPEGNVVWKFKGDGFFWRAYHYTKDHPAIIALGL